MSENLESVIIESKQILNYEIQREVEKIYENSSRILFTWKVLSATNKILNAINFASLWYSIIIPDSIIGLALSIYTLSFSVIFNSDKHFLTLDKLVQVYGDEIIPKLEEYLRNCLHTDYLKLKRMYDRKKKDNVNRKTNNSDNSLDSGNGNGNGDDFNNKI